ncbi:uracil-DNA glycosylase family protein [Kangiella geojedonensis]|uniref:IclR family transcriptional regulator n=1 Tax=Kangiella geojedonensis TaxID=914150 RepID=A0A0F6RDA4_9GAMM|nr:uracil-DNA glycosylase family protein [Kangiella geojedonensis]AKE53123.1 IclR family transcriptional regulator [Kangiella geojedonensis]
MSNRLPLTEPVVEQARKCQLCDDLPLGPKPILQFSPDAKILIAGQAPGKITHERGRPFDDASGVRLREWLGVEETTFYDEKQFAILPMGFCYPGKGKSGDLPPRPICAQTWQHKLLGHLKELELVVVIGQYALQWHLGIKKSQAITPIVKDWAKYQEIDVKSSEGVDNGIKKAVTYFPLPHPSPRNNIWLKKNPWFRETLLSELQESVFKALF